MTIAKLVFIFLYGLNFCFLTPSIFPVDPKTDAKTFPIYSIIQYGAVGDGKTADTKAIQSAIDAAAAAGGGTVFFPAGTYLSSTLILKSHITLHLDSGSILLGSRNPADYPPTIPKIRSYTDNYANQSLIYGEELIDVAITGRGTIDGQGAAFHWPEYRNRPFNIRLISCRDILVEGITLKNSPMWMQHYLNCENVVVRGISVFNHVNYNDDGIDIDSCRNVRISDCSFDSLDDALCLKSTTDRPCEDVTITNCVLSSRCNAFKMGTESNGGFINITLTNCTIRSLQNKKTEFGEGRGLAGIALEIVDGGRLDRVAISNVTMQGILSPIFLRLGNRARPYQKDMPEPKIGSFKNVSIDNIIATEVSKNGCSITGEPEQFIENVSLQNIHLQFEGGGTLEEARQAVPHKPKEYPDPWMYDVLPAYGFYCRDVKGLKLNNVTLSFQNTDLRPAFICDTVQNLVVNGMEGKGMLSGEPTIVLTSVQDAFIHNCRIPEPINLFLRVQKNSKNISLIGNDLLLAKKAYELDSPNLESTFFEKSNRMNQ